MKGRIWLIALALLFSASNVFGLITKTIGSGRDFSGFDSACNWLQGQTQPLADDYEFVADSGSYWPCSLIAVNTGTRTVTFRAATQGVEITSGGFPYGFLVEQTANVVLQGLTVTASANDCIYYDSSPGGTVRACSVWTVGDNGILARQSDRIIVDSCRVIVGRVGISLFRSPGARVRRSTVAGWSSDCGIDVQGSPDVRLDTVVVVPLDSIIYAIRFDSSPRGRTHFARCTQPIFNKGISLTYSDSSLADSCFITSALNSIEVQSSPGSIIRCCSLASSSGYGVFVSGSDRVRIDSSLLSAPGTAAYLTYSNGCRLLASRLYDGGACIGNDADRDSILQCIIQPGGSGPVVVNGSTSPLGVANVIANNLLVNWDCPSIDLANQDSTRLIYNSISASRVGSTAHGVQASNVNALVSLNNIIKTSDGGGASRAYYLFGGSSFAPTGTNYNDLYCVFGGLVYDNGTDYANLAAWRASSGNPDTLSISLDPLFKGGSDYSLDSTSPCRRAGTPIPGITTDLYGNLRHVLTPSMGAIEWVPTPPGVFSLLSPSDGAVNQPNSLSLFWGNSANADTYVVYLDRNPSPVTVVKRQTDTSYACSGLLRDSTYFWKVVAMSNAGGTRTAGIWSFRISPTSPDTPFVPEPPLPLGEKHKGIKAGGALRYIDVGTDDATPMIYALKGNGTYEFYRFDVLHPWLGWVADASIPLLNRLGKKKAPGKGATLTAAAGKIYATKGNGVYDWWEFTPGLAAPGTWLQKEDVPLGGKKVKDGAGSATVHLGSQDYVYLLKGGGSMEFYRYDPLGNSWLTLPTAPGGLKGKGYKSGSAIVYYPDDKDGVNRHIYLLKGSYNEFYSFGVDDNSWTVLETLPRGLAKKKAKDGAGLAYHADTVFAIKGNKTNEFWKYTCGGAYWLRGPDMPGLPVKAGGSITYSDADKSLYIIKGGGTTEFYRMPLAVSLFSGRSSPGGVLTGRSSPVLRNSLAVSPNPVTANATITWSLARAGSACLRMYDVTGKLVQTLHAGHTQPGTSDFELRASDFPSGVYLLEFEADGYRATEKLIIE